MNDDDLLNFRHTVDTLDDDLTRLQGQVIELQKENQALKNLIFQLAGAVERIPEIMNDFTPRSNSRISRITIFVT